MRTTTDTDPRTTRERAGQDVGLMLTVVDAPARNAVGVRRRLVEGETILLGRTPTCSLPGVFTESSVSRNHAKIAMTTEGPMLTDLRSRNGTSVNGATVDRHRLRVGDVVGIGDVLLLVHEGTGGTRVPRHDTLIGIGAGLMHVLDQVELVAGRTTTVLIVGETGTGKELVASELHRNSNRSGDLVSINCAGMTDNLLSSELFGHVRGAFTGAQRDRKGLIESARGGTLFLDEITDASPSFQAALLRLFETGEYRPVGSDRAQQADVRFVAAVQPRVTDAVRDGDFRLDLWSRLARWVIRLPALDERPEDIPSLTRHFARRYAGRHVIIAPPLLVTLMRRPWAGNIRELQSAVERLVVASRGAAELDMTTWATLDMEPIDRAADAPRGEPPRVPASRQERRGRVPRPDREALEALLEQEDGNVRATARVLGVTRKTLYRWLESLEVDLDRFR